MKVTARLISDYLTHTRLSLLLLFSSQCRVVAKSYLRDEHRS